MGSSQKEPVVIALMGATGTGKSTFVNLVTGKEDAKVAHGLYSGTSALASYPFTYRSQAFIIIDTPGFDDSTLSDREILRILVTYLTTTFISGQKLSGILYFHRITDPRMQGSALSNLQTFKQLCGADCFKNILLGTSFWGSLPEEIGVKRERELMQQKELWGGMIKRGSRAVRIPETQAKARELLSQFASNKPTILQAQREMVLEGKSFDQTTASQQLRSEEELQRQEKENKRQVKEQAARHDREIKERARKAEEEAYKKRQENARKIALQEAEQKRLKAQHQAEERKQKEAEQAAKAEKERIEREAAALAERMEQLKIERANEERRKKWERHLEKVKTSFEILAAAKQANKIMVNFREFSEAYNSFCNNCFATLGDGVRYKCRTCNDGDFDLCATCHSALGVFCDDKSHFSSMEKTDAVLDGNGCCNRVKTPYQVGTILLCNRCSGPCGSVYLHCCWCCDDQFDMCISCALKYKTCYKSWSLSGHPLDVCSRYVE